MLSKSFRHNENAATRSHWVLVHRGIFWSRRGPCFLAARSYPSAITHSAFLDQPRRRRPRPNENCPLRMRWANSMPAIVMAAFANDLNPNDTKLGDTNPRGRLRSPLLGHYARSMPSEREEKDQPLTSAACGGRLRCGIGWIKIKGRKER